MERKARDILVIFKWVGRVKVCNSVAYLLCSLRNPVLHQALQLLVCRFVAEIAIKQVCNQAAQGRTLCHC